MDSKIVIQTGQISISDEGIGNTYVGKEIYKKENIEVMRW